MYFVFGAGKFSSSYVHPSSLKNLLSEVKAIKEKCKNEEETQPAKKKSLPLPKKFERYSKIIQPFVYIFQIFKTIAELNIF